MPHGSPPISMHIRQWSPEERTDCTQHSIKKGNLFFLFDRLLSSTSSSPSAFDLSSYRSHSSRGEYWYCHDHKQHGSHVRPPANLSTRAVVVRVLLLPFSFFFRLFARIIQASQTASPDPAITKTQRKNTADISASPPSSSPSSPMRQVGFLS